ncbi:unnamed protein product, partial [marine sediment metagenome]
MYFVWKIEMVDKSARTFKTATFQPCEKGEKPMC